MQKKKFILRGSGVLIAKQPCRTIDPYHQDKLREIIEATKLMCQANMYYKDDDWKAYKVIVKMINGNEKEYTYEELDKIIV